ncbi:MAG: hypothetical protein WB539_16815, partial [Planktothrix agardhii]|uniref:hypothetical protein n=1 Tax=Planktothrix agardhii TaxID=1160 RepID=UPI003C35718C
LIIINVTEKAYESVTLGEPGTGVLEVQKVAIESIWEFSEMSIAGDPCIGAFLIIINHYPIIFRSVIRNFPLSTYFVLGDD